MPENDYSVIKTEDINYDEEYKYSVDELSQDLLKSIIENGILQPVIVFPEKKKYRIISGHNRYKAAVRNEVSEIPVIKCDLKTFDFTSYILLRNYRNLISSVKKIKYIFNFKVTDHNIVKKLNIPVLSADLSFCAGVLQLPITILNYLDIKNVNFKVIEKINNFDQEHIKILSELIISNQMRINVFRDIVSMLYDFNRFRITCDFSDIKYESIKKYEDDLISRMKALRFPKYSESIKKSDSILNKYKNTGIEIGIPGFFEGNCLNVEFNFKNINDLDKKIVSLQNIDRKDLEDLLDLF